MPLARPASPLRPPRRLLGLALGLALSLTGCGGARPATTPAGLATLEGKVSLDGTGVGDAEVFLLSAHFQLTPDAPPDARTVSGSDGSFRLEVPPGTYLLLARRGGLFSYFGRNPVQPTVALTGLHLPLVPAHPAVRAVSPPGEEHLAGRVLEAGQPVADARVFAYLDAGRGLRGPGYAVSDPTGPDGAYRLPLPPGTYFVAARFRAGGWKTGTLDPGDRFGVLSDFPLSLGSGESVEADIETVEVPGREQMARFQGRFARLSGRIVDGGGSPVPGLRACLYESPQMLDRPSVVSDPTGPDGRFSLETPLTGVFYLGAREVLGGPPAPGERVGFYRGPLGAAVEVAPGARLGDLIVVIQEVP